MKTMKEQTYLQDIEEVLGELAFSQLASNIQEGQNRRIGILGGTFNPPHIGHMLMAEQVGRQLELDEVWFMPTAKPPHAPGKQTIASQHRLEMLRLATLDNPFFKIQPYEVNRGGKNYTVDTMRHFKEEYPQVDFYFMIGSDSANDLPTWHKADELARLVQLVGVRRPGHGPYRGGYPILWLSTPEVDISSTEIRLRVFLEQTIRYLVHPDVALYIERHQLYQ